MEAEADGDADKFLLCVVLRFTESEAMRLFYI